ncbi:MAG: homoserine dehydrogenase [Anaerolineales bacterium]
MTHYKLAFLGFGNVGRALAELLLRKRAELRDERGITFSVTGIATARHGMVVNPNGLDLSGALDLLRTGRPLTLLTNSLVSDSLDFIRKCGADVLFENTPVNYESGQPAIDHVRLALESGMHVATANKGTLVHAYRELRDLAAAKNRRFYFESTVMDGAPIFSLFREALPGATLKGFRGVLNSTTNLILTRMEDGDSFEDAVRYAQEIGIAETDPSGDIDGWDAAIKVSALATVLMDTPLKPQEVRRTGIRAITPQMVAQARAQGKRYKLVCAVRRAAGKLEASVAPELVPVSSPFYGLEGTSSVIEFQTDVLGDLTVLEANPGPHTTAYGLLADWLNLAKLA